LFVELATGGFGLLVPGSGVPAGWFFGCCSGFTDGRCAGADGGLAPD
jgi:hypothetical protein